MGTGLINPSQSANGQESKATCGLAQQIKQRVTSGTSRQAESSKDHAVWL